MPMLIPKVTLAVTRHGARASLASSKRTFSATLAYYSPNRINRVSSIAFFSTDTSGLKSQDGWSPFIKRSERPDFRPSLYHVDSPNASRIQRKSRLCPTRDLNFTAEAWAIHKAPGRHLRHLSRVFVCASFQRLVFPDLFLTATVAAGVTYYNVAFGVAEPFYFDKTAFTSCCMAMSVLAGFRLNTSYSRFNEARTILGQLNNASRDIMGQSCMFLNDDNKLRMQKLLKAFSVALHFHLNEKGGYFKLYSSHPDTKSRVNAAYRDEMREIFFPPNETAEGKRPSDEDFELICEAYESGSHVPLLILSFMRRTVIENEPSINPSYARSMDDQISNLTSSLGGCERILRTPLPTTFTANTSRLLSLWSLSLPLALYPLTGPHWTIPFSVIMSYVVLSIEDIGVEIEEPFQVLPLRQYSEGTADSLDAIVKAYDMYPKGQSKP
mmetsp:Transcript_18962/g.47049  ORF Transcript_18962/g.47049 Transcript_18962/m.47049 type:complete len:440 (+) Transcript_18962:118-1437(+)